MNRTRMTLITFAAAALGLCNLAQAAVVPSTDVVPPGRPAPAHQRMGPGAAGREHAPPAERGMRHGPAAQRFAHAHPRLFQRWMQHQSGQSSGRFHRQLERGQRPGEMAQPGPAGPQRDRRFAPGQPSPREGMRGNVRERIRERIRAIPPEQREQMRNQLKQRWQGRQHEMNAQPHLRPDQNGGHGLPQRDPGWRGRGGERLERPMPSPSQPRPRSDMPGFRENPAPGMPGDANQPGGAGGRATLPRHGPGFRGPDARRAAEGDDPTPAARPGAACAATNA
jgi:hypothetical protein